LVRSSRMIVPSLPSHPPVCRCFSDPTSARIDNPGHFSPGPPHYFWHFDRRVWAAPFPGRCFSAPSSFHSFAVLFPGLQPHFPILFFLILIPFWFVSPLAVRVVFCELFFPILFAIDDERFVLLCPPLFAVKPLHLPWVRPEVSAVTLSLTSSFPSWTF